MLKTHSRFILILALIVSVSGCGRNTPDEMDFGTLENSTYRNNYLGFSIKIPPEWSIIDTKSKQQMMEKGTEMLSGEDKNMKAILKASQMQTVNLLNAFRYPLGTPVNFNPSISVLAEKVSHLPGIKRGKDYLFHTRKLFEASQMKVSFPKAISTTPLDGIEFDVMPVQMAVSGQTVDQLYYTAVMKGYALGIILSFTTDEEKAILDDTLNSIDFE